MNKILAFSLCTATAVMAGGYKIPESSLKAVALSSANVANAYGSDAAYFNPANMVFNNDEQSIEADMTYIGLSGSTFTGTANGDSSGATSEGENFLVPSLHYVSDGKDDVRVGVSLVSPAGLTKRWDEQPAKATAEEFSLQTIELNPSVAVPVGDKAAVAAGIRFVHSSGVVKSSSVISRDMTGASNDIGYNLALSYRPTPALSMAATYRSNIDLSIEGDAKLYSGGTLVYDGGASVTVPIPATLSLAAAYTFGPAITVEFVYERTMWSAYDELDFEYTGNIGPLQPYFDDPIAKNWKDTNTYRLGITKAHAGFTGMFGIAYDETPIPDESYSFELPDANALVLSMGVLYPIDKSWSVGLAGLVSMKEKRTVTNDDLEGTFDATNIYLLSTGLEYRF